MTTNSESQPPLHPHLRRDDNGTHLIVNGKPFLMLAGELHNSSLSSARYMADVWPAMKEQAINTLLGVVSWEQIEPVEGTFDFSELDKVILGAREHGMHLALLWFGAYKNALSTYVPSWVKKDAKRFPRVRSIEAGGGRKILDVITPLSMECAEADAKAFGKLMSHLEDFDADHSTVLMIQVQNESGILGDSRDRSSLAEAAFKEPVPEPLLRHLADNPHPQFAKRFPNIPQSGRHSWEEVFGAGAPADEMFMAFHFSRYVEKVAASGKASYPLPFYANTWLNLDGPGDLDAAVAPSFVASAVVAGGSGPGIYPSGGPCAHVSDVWRFGAPSLDFFAPDLYMQDYETVCKDYTVKGNPLFIPEQRRDEEGARRMWLAYGTYGALGVSPFGIDTGAEAVGREYKLLSQVKDLVLGASPADRFGFFFDEVENAPRVEKPWVKVFGTIQVTVERAFTFGRPGPAGGLIIRLADRKFLVVGYGFQARFKGVGKGVGFTGILSAKEMEGSQDGTLRVLRLWNGDETRGGEAMVMPNEVPDYGDFPIATTIPARTGIAEVEVYTLEDDA
ncbi:glycoside hydrolase superfamily [Thelonectria olida]|uniref:Glycoside hydrolase superfamily n=1 Tax=Thelonectria olida TaxID=1576542 RepID=A0A9P9AKX0_9HYPO|nr:glycoside hydrolase superfamily [Thelonectria olida]